MYINHKGDNKENWLWLVDQSDWLWWLDTIIKPQAGDIQNWTWSASKESLFSLQNTNLQQIIQR